MGVSDLNNSRQSSRCKFGRSEIVDRHVLMSGTGMERGGADHRPVALGPGLVSDCCQ